MSDVYFKKQIWWIKSSLLLPSLFPVLCDKAAGNVDLLCYEVSSSTDMKYSFFIIFLNSQKANVY